MTLEEKIAKDLIVAMKARNKATLRSLRAIKAEILLHNTSGSGVVLDHTGEIKILQRMVKQRKESLAMFEEQSREDLAVIEREEIEVIAAFLPQQMGEEELTTFVSALVTELGASGMKDMGRVM
ncbi:MAG: GatB/YqeY domain-containing protein, partial [Bacteroidetes bacterium]